MLQGVHFFMDEVNNFNLIKNKTNKLVVVNAIFVLSICNALQKIFVTYITSCVSKTTD